MEINEKQERILSVCDKIYYACCKNNFNLLLDLSPGINDEILRIKESNGGCELNFDLYNGIKEYSLDERLSVVVDFYKQFNINVDVIKLFNEGIIKFYEHDNNKVFTGTQFHESSFFDEADDEEEKAEVNSYTIVDLIDVCNTGHIADSAVLVHELSHYRDEGCTQRSSVSDMFTEALAYAEELIFLDNLDEKYQEEKDFFMAFIANQTYAVNTIICQFLVFVDAYNRVGNIDYESVSMIYNISLEDYNNLINNVFENIPASPRDFINNLFYVIGFPLGIYMFMKYKKDPSFFDTIEELHSLFDLDDVNLVNNKIGITSTNLIDEITNSFQEYLSLYVKEQVKRKV